MTAGEPEWRQVTCQQREAIVDGLGRSYNAPADPVRPVSGRSDLDGEFGMPCVETVWGDGDDDDRELLRDVRHPVEHDDRRPVGVVVADRLPCEHYVAVGTRAEAFVTPAPRPTTTEGQP